MMPKKSSWSFSVLFTENSLKMPSMLVVAVGLGSSTVHLPPPPQILEQPLCRKKRKFSAIVLYLLKAGTVSLSPITNKIVTDKSIVQPVSFLAQIFLFQLILLLPTYRAGLCSRCSFYLVDETQLLMLQLDINWLSSKHL